MENELKLKEKEKQSIQTSLQSTIAAKENENKKLLMKLRTIESDTIKNFEGRLKLKEQDFCNLRTELESNLKLKHIMIQKQSNEIEQLHDQINSNQDNISEEKEKDIYEKLKLKDQDVNNLKTEFESNLKSKDMIIQKQSEEIKQLLAQINSNFVTISEEKNLDGILKLKDQDFCNLKTKFESNLRSKDIMIQNQFEEIEKLHAQLSSNEVCILREKEKFLEEKLKIQEQEFYNLKTKLELNLEKKEIIIQKQSAEIQLLLDQINSERVAITEENDGNDTPSDECVQQIFKEYEIPSLIPYDFDLGLYFFWLYFL